MQFEVSVEYSTAEERNSVRFTVERDSMPEIGEVLTFGTLSLPVNHVEDVIDDSTGSVDVTQALVELPDEDEYTFEDIKAQLDNVPSVSNIMQE